MDPPPSSDRGSESSTQQPRRLKRKSVAQPTPTSKKKKKLPKKTEEVYYTIKGILSERKEGQFTEFLIDWDDHPITGETYEPTWEPYEHVTKAAIEEWRATNSHPLQKRSRSPHKRPRPRSLSEDSGINRPAKRRDPVEFTSAGQPKQPRLQGSQAVRAAHLRNDPGAQNRSEAGSDIQEIKDSYEDEAPSTGSNFRVVIPASKELNLNEYTPVAPSQSSISSHVQSQDFLSQSGQVSESQRAKAPRTRKPFIWDEDIVPDSQYLASSGSYIPSVPTSAKEICTPEHNKEPSTKESARSSNLQFSSKSVGVGLSSTAPSHREGNSAQAAASDRDRIIGVRRTSSSSPSATKRITAKTNLSQISREHQRKPFPNTKQYSDSQNLSIPDSLASNLVPPVDVTSALYSLAPLVSKRNHNTTINRDHQQAESGIAPTVAVPGTQDIDQSSIISEQFLTQEPLRRQAPPDIPNPSPLNDSEEANQNTCGPVTNSAVGALINSQDRATSLPTNNSQDRISINPEPQRSQSAPTDSSQEQVWQAAQIVSPIGPISSQELSLEQDHLPEQSVQTHDTQDLRSTLSPSDKEPDTSSNKSERDLNSTRHNTEASQRPTSAANLPTKEVQVIPSIEIEVGSNGAQLRQPEVPSSLVDLDMAEVSTIASSSKSRSPSTIPPHLVPAMPHSDRLLPLRDSITDMSRSHHMTHSSPRISIEEQASSSPDYLTVRQLGPNEYIVPLPIMNAVRDVYDTTIKSKKGDILRFLNDPLADIDLSLVLEQMMEELKLICDHQDLVVDEPSTQKLDDDAQARYAVTISTKFLFMRQFLDALRTADVKVHVVILARDAVLPILEALLRSQNYSYSRPDQANSNFSDQEHMQVTLLPTWIDVRDCDVPPASVVVAFDSSSQGGEEYYQNQSANPQNPVQRAPLLLLVTAYSIEHLELCIPTSMDSSERMERLLRYIARTRKFAGILDSRDYPSPEESAARAAQFVVRDNVEANWPLMPMPDITLASQEEGRNARAANPPAESFFSPLETRSQTGFKRPSKDFDTPEGDASSKRQRITPIRQIAEPSSQLVDATTAELQARIRSLEARCQDTEKSLRRIQPQYQKALNARNRSENEKKKAIENENRSAKKLEQQLEVNAKLKEENATIKSKLSAAEEALANSSNPDVADLQKTKNSLVEAQAEIDRLKKSRASLEKRLDYATDMYQQTSSESQEMRNELTTLKEEREVLRVAASSHRMEIQKLNHSSILKQQNDQINELKRDNAEVTRLLERTNEKLEAVLNGRRTTRGTSVPRSPRMGMQNMSPRPRVLGPSSRGGSPAPGGMASTFGGEIGVGGRFGAHLQ